MHFPVSSERLFKDLFRSAQAMAILKSILTDLNTSNKEDTSEITTALCDSRNILLLMHNFLAQRRQTTYYLNLWPKYR